MCLRRVDALLMELAYSCTDERFRQRLIRARGALQRDVAFEKSLYLM